MNDPNTLPNYPSSTTETASATTAGMSTPQTLTNIFFEPGRTFEVLRERPRFLVAAAIIILLVSAFSALFIERVGYDNIMRTQIESRFPDMDAEQRDRIIESQSNSAFRAIAYVMPVIVMIVVTAAGAGLYLLGAMLMAGGINYRQALAVWAYASLPPTILLMLANFVLLFLKPEVDPIKDQRGLAHANLGLLVNGTDHPVLATALSAVDLFAFYGLFLAALGLSRVARLSSGAAWAIVIAVWMLGVAFRILFAAISGNPS